MICPRGARSTIAWPPIRKGSPRAAQGRLRYPPGIPSLGAAEAGRAQSAGLTISPFDRGAASVSGSPKPRRASAIIRSLSSAPNGSSDAIPFFLGASSMRVDKVAGLAGSASVMPEAGNFGALASRGPCWQLLTLLPEPVLTAS